MSTYSGRSRQHSRYRPKRAYSPPPSRLDSRASSRSASTIELPRHHSHNSSSYPSHRREGKYDTLAKASLFVGLLQVIAGALQLWTTREQKRRSDRQERRSDDERRRQRRRQKREEERWRAQRDYDDWQERSQRPRLADEPYYEGSERGGRGVGDEREYDRRVRRSESRSTYG